MDEDVIRVAATAAAGVIFRAMGTAIWKAVRDRWVGLLGGGDAATEDAMIRELDDAASRPSHGRGEDEFRELEAEWRGTIRALLREHPALVEVVQAELSREREREVQSGPGLVVDQVASVRRGVSIQSGRDSIIR